MTEFGAYHPGWMAQYGRHVAALQALLADNFCEAYPIGSAVIEFIVSHPTLDILLVVHDKEKAHSQLKEYPQDEISLRIFKKDDPKIVDYLAFRDYLRAHPEEAERYSDTKEAIWETVSSVDEYHQKKGIEIDAIQKRANEWHAWNMQHGMHPDTPFPIPFIGKETCFLKNFITKPTIEVGDYTYYHDFNDSRLFETQNVLYHFDQYKDKLIIGKFCQIACGTKFFMNACAHQIDGFSTFPFMVTGGKWQESYMPNFPYKGDTVVGNDVWFGNDCMIMPGVKIGDGAIIGTRALVTKDVPPYTIVGGVPAKVIRKRFDDATIAKLLELKWWDWPLDKISEKLPYITGSDIAKLTD